MKPSKFDSRAGSISKGFEKTKSHERIEAFHAAGLGDDEASGMEESLFDRNEPGKRKPSATRKRSPTYKAGSTCFDQDVLQSLVFQGYSQLAHIAATGEPSPLKRKMTSRKELRDQGFAE